MGRANRRRQEKLDKNKKVRDEDTYIDSGFNLKGALITGTVIVGILVVLYFFMAIFVTEEIDLSNKKESTNNTSNNSNYVYNKILASNIFNQQESSYYVYFYDFKNEDYNTISTINSVGGILYKVDTSSALNSKYIVEDNSNKNAKTLDELKVKSPTLIKIENDTIVEYYEGDEIKERNN